MPWTGAVSFLPPIPDQSLCSVGVVTVFLRQGARLGPATWARAEDKPRIQLVLLNKVLEDGNTLYRQARLEEAALRYRYGLRKVGPWYYWTEAI